MTSATQAAPALETVLAEQAPRAYRLALAITRRAGDAEHVVGEVLLALLQGPDLGADPEAAARRVCRLAARAALARAGGSGAGPSGRPARPTFGPDGHREGPPAHVLADWTDRPVAELLGGDTRAVVERTLDGLTGQERAILVLHELEGRSLPEAADLVGLPAAVTRTLLHRARIALREELTLHLGAPPRRPA